MHTFPKANQKAPQTEAPGTFSMPSKTLITPCNAPWASSYSCSLYASLRHSSSFTHINGQVWITLRRYPFKTSSHTQMMVYNKFILEHWPKIQLSQSTHSSAKLLCPPPKVLYISVYKFHHICWFYYCFLPFLPPLQFNMLNNIPGLVSLSPSTLFFPSLALPYTNITDSILDKLRFDWSNPEVW